MGNLSANWSVATVTANGQYSLGSNCQGAATLKDAKNMVSYVFTFSVVGNASNFDFMASSPNLILAGSGHTSFVNPGQAVVNRASFRAGMSGPATFFTLFGQNLVSSKLQANTLPLPDTLLTTSVTVNGENAPLFYVESGQINAQMPTDIQPGLAIVIVKNGTTSSRPLRFRFPRSGPESTCTETITPWFKTKTPA